MKPIFASLALVAALTSSASASQIFNFAADSGSSGNSYGNSLTFAESVGPVTVTATAFSLPAGYNGNSTFAAAAVDNYNGTNLGLGVCSANDPSGTGCSSPSHQVNNGNGTEFIVLQFSQAVNLNGATISIANYAPIGSTSDVDLTYYTASTALAAGAKLSTLGTGTDINQNCGGAGSTSCQGLQFNDVLGSNTGTSSYLIIAASVSNSDGFTDAFKVNGLSIPNSATPEPGTLGTISLALLGFAIGAARKRKLRSIASVL
jgi:hypothetical protein